MKEKCSFVLFVVVVDCPNGKIIVSKTDWISAQRKLNVNDIIGWQWRRRWQPWRWRRRAGEKVLSRISVISNAKERCTVNRIGESTWNKDEAGCKEGRGGRCSSGRSGARGGDGGSGDGDWDSGNGWGGNGGDPRDFINGQNLRHCLLLHHFVLLLLPLLAPCRHFCIRVERMPRWHVEEVRSLT